jgi:hypothetical protein
LTGLIAALPARGGATRQTRHALESARAGERPMDPDTRRIVASWNGLPETTRRIVRRHGPARAKRDRRIFYIAIDTKYQLLCAAVK